MSSLERDATMRQDFSDQRWSTRLWGILSALCLVLFLDGLDESLVAVALPSIGEDLGIGTAELQWILTSYFLGYGGLLLVGGRTADLLGRRRVFLTALSVFAVASLLGGITTSPSLLVATRFAKGLAAAFTAPTSLSLLTTTFREGPSRNRALAVFGLFGALGYSSGLILGGVFTGIGWRWVFALPAPLALVALVLGYLLIPRDRPVTKGKHDPAGALALTAGMLLVVYTVATASGRGWTSGETVGTIVVSSAVLVAFVLIEKYVSHPLVRLGILRQANTIRANLSIMTLMGSYMGFQFLLTLFLQEGRGWSPLHTATAFLPVGVTVVIGSPFAGRLVNRYGTTLLIRVAMISTTVGYVWFLSSAGTSPKYLSTVFPALLLLGCGFAFGYCTIIAQATEGIDDCEQGLASGLVQTSSMIGAAVVLAALTTTLPETGHGDGDFTPYRMGLNLVTGIALAGLSLSLVPRHRFQRGHT